MVKALGTVVMFCFVVVLIIIFNLSKKKNKKLVVLLQAVNSYPPSYQL